MEAEFQHYARALDKIYTKIEMAKMVPQVVQKMRIEYYENPHELYVLVCKKYGIEPEEKFDVDLLVYGRHKPKKHKLEQVRDTDRVGERKERETQKKNEETIEEKKSEETIVETTDKPTEKVDEVTENKEAREEDAVKPVEEIEEKKEELPSATMETEAERKQGADSQWQPVREREIVAQSPRRAKLVERMYQVPAANQNVSQGRAVASASQGRAVDERKVSSRASPRASSNAGYQQTASPRAAAQNMIEFVNIYPGDICETMVLTQSDENAETGFWIPARVITIDTDQEKMDLEVLQPVKYGLSKMARNVPFRYVRAPSEVTFEY